MRSSLAEGLAADQPVLLGEEVHGEVDAGKLTPGHSEVAGHAGASGQHDGFEPVAQVLVGDVLADVHAALELHALAGHELDALVDHPLLQLEIGDAVAQQPAGRASFS